MTATLKTKDLASFPRPANYRFDARIPPARTRLAVSGAFSFSAQYF
jgi:hypothetical protein